MESLVAFFRYFTIPVSAPPLNRILPDPDDVFFLDVAAAANAILVTGNRRHFPKPATGSVVVLNPADCLEALRRTL